MIEPDESETYYYHYDALGSVVALSDSSGDTVQTYEYSVYGQPAVEDINHPNPYMFAGRRFDIEIGLYYNRARYYNPFTGRFLQTDPIGYGAGMNMYTYCRNNPLTLADPYGLDANPNNHMDGPVQIVTGRYWVLPETVNIDLVLASEILYDFFKAGIIDIGEPDNRPSLNAIDNQLATYQALLKVGPVLALAVLDAEQVPVINLNLGWSAYIEVQDWADLNDNGQIDSDDEFSDPYWIEIEGFGSGAGNDYELSAWVTDRYPDITEAADAAGTAIGYAWDIGIPRVLPTTQEVKEKVQQDYLGDPYNRIWHHEYGFVYIIPVL